jgi:hypothetical protein
MDPGSEGHANLPPLVKDSEHENRDLEVLKLSKSVIYLTIQGLFVIYITYQKGLKWLTLFNFVAHVQLPPECAIVFVEIADASPSAISGFSKTNNRSE